jgi:XRE family transcriptional regulator, regulator of sulfur utilization
MPSDRDRDATAVSIETRIGDILKRHRERQGLSLRTLGERAGFSASFLSQVETGHASPSIASLERIAGELGLTLGELFADSPSAAVVRADSRPGFTSMWSRARVESLMSSTTPRALEAIMVTLSPGGMSGKHLAPHASDQFAYVLRGTVRLFLDDEEIELREGDAAHIPAKSPHRWENRGRGKTDFLIVSSRHRQT